MKKIRRILYNVYITFFSKIFYRLFFKKYFIRYIKQVKKREDAYFIFYPHAIGDVFNLSLFINQFQKRNNIDKINIVCKSYMKSLSKFMKKFCIENIYNLDKNLYFISKLSGHIIDKKNKIIIINHVNYHEKFRSKKYFIEYFPKLLDLSIEKSDYKKIFTEAYKKLNQSLEKEKIDKVIIFPYPGTLEEIDLNYWNDIVKLIKSYKIDIYTNIINDQIIIKHTKPLKCSLDKIVKLVDNKTLIISRRNGLNDLFTFINCYQLIIYKRSYFDEIKRYSLYMQYEILNRKKDLIEMTIDRKYDLDTVKEIKKNIRILIEGKDD